MSPELLDPEKFNFKNGRVTKESDCYALGMVVLEVLTGQVPFACHYHITVMKKVTDGERPERPRGPEAVWFTDGLWETLEQCWSHQPKLRPSIKVVLERLEQSFVDWQPPRLRRSDGFQADSDYESISIADHYPCMVLFFVLDLHSPANAPAAGQTVSQDGQSLVLSQHTPHDVDMGQSSF
jgi:hypothetical protein